MHTNPLSSGPMPGKYQKIKIHGFHLKARTDLPTGWLPLLIANLDKLPHAPLAPDRQWAFVNLPENHQNLELFIKTYAPKDSRHSSFRRNHPLRRLLPRYAAKEAEAALRFQAKNLPAPELYVFGEEWKKGIRYRGVVIMEAVKGASAQSLLKHSPDLTLIGPVFRTIAEIHSCGLSHGDAHLPNFIWDQKQIKVIDIERSKKLTVKGQQADLMNIMLSILIEIEDTALITEGLRLYEETGPALPFHKGEAIKEALRRAKRIHRSASRSARFNIARPPVIEFEEFEKALKNRS